MISNLLASATVTDLGRAEQWYTRLFGRASDAAPMSGLREWHLGMTFGVQVWSEPERAGRSSIVLAETELDAAAARLSAAGIDHGGPEQATSSRILILTDPDGNRVVLTGS